MGKNRSALAFQIPCNAMGLCLAGVTGSEAAALRAMNEGAEGAAIIASGTTNAAGGCFPSFWNGEDFAEWLAGSYKGDSQISDQDCLKSGWDIP